MQKNKTVDVFWNAVYNISNLMLKNAFLTSLDFVFSLAFNV